MKLLFLISGWNVPSSRFRLLQFVPHLRDAGHVVNVAASFPPKYDYFPWLGFRPSQLLKRATRCVHLLIAWLRRYDVVVVERELFNDGSWWFERQFRKLTRGLVLDVDDGIFVSFPEKFGHLAQLSNLVIAGNPLIEAYVRLLNPAVEVVPTCIDMDQYPSRDQELTAGPLVIGWMGSTVNLNYLTVMAGALRELAQREAFELRLVAPEPGPITELPLEGVTIRYVRWDAATEVEWLRTFDIGLMPLLDDDWSRYKCGLKLLQYMAVGIPGVASPVGVNRQIVDSGTDGFLAANEAEWCDILQLLCRDAGLRRRVGNAGRKKVEESYSVQGNLPHLLRCLKRAAASSSKSAGSGETDPNE